MKPMVGIPPVLPDDPEDVVWALQTAEALFRRDERADALVWLRRAAQSAGEAERDERALTLSRAAADIAQAIADDAKAETDVAVESEDIEVSSLDMREVEGGDATQQTPAGRPQSSAEMKNALPSFMQDELDAAPLPPPIDAPAFPAPAPKPAAKAEAPRPGVPRADAPKRPPVPPPLPPRARPPTAPMSPSRPFAPAAAPPPPIRLRENSSPVITQDPRLQPRPKAPSVNEIALPSAASGSAPDSGRWMRPPLASKPEVIEVPEVEPIVQERPSLTPMRAASPSAPAFPDIPAPMTMGAPDPSEMHVEAFAQTQVEETTQQTRIEDLQHTQSVEAAPPEHVDAPRPPDSERTPFGGAAEDNAGRSTDVDADESIPEAMPTQPETIGETEGSSPGLISPTEIDGVSAADPTVDPSRAQEPDEPAFGKEDDDEGSQEPEEQAAHQNEKRTPLVPTAMLDIDALEAFADLPDDVREEFAKEARIIALGDGDSIGSFALVAVLSGEIDIMARDARVPAVRLVAQQVLYARGSIEADLPMRLVGASDVAEIAVWDKPEVEKVMRGCPWVEDDLRAASDPIQAVVGMTLGPFGERLDGELRALVTSRFSVQSLAEGDVIVAGGAAVAGLTVIGAGQVEIVSGSDIKGVLGPGDILFPAEVVVGGRAPAEARAGRGGALLLSCDRGATQELFMVCPPLLDILTSSM